MKITFIGQSTFKITLGDGRVILTDPWFGNSLLLRASPLIIGPADIKRCDLMLVSHNHIDHFDRFAIRLAKRCGSRLIGPKSVIRRAIRNGIEDVMEIKPEKGVDVDGINIRRVIAHHPLARDAIGFVINLESKNIYFSGDTRYNVRVVNNLNETGIHLALVQIACARYFGRKDGMDIGDASRLIHEIRPHIVIPMHYHGRFKRADPEDFSTLLKDTSVEVVILQTGEEIEI